MNWEKHYYDRVAQFREENAARDDTGAKNVVMIGSSHVERFDSNRYLPGRRVVNRGIGSDRIGVTERGILHRLDESLFDCHPGFIILENGVNDLGELWRYGMPSVDEIATCYRKVVATIRARLPDVPLVVVGLFPTRGAYVELNWRIVEFNRRLERIAGDFECGFVDVFGSFADNDGLLREEFSLDGLHLTEAGYRQWAEQLERILPQMSSS